MHNVRIYYCLFNFDCHSNSLLVCVINCACRMFHTCAHMEDFAPRTLAMATSDRQLPNFGAHNKPNQPLQFDFPKLEFGKTRILIPTATPMATPPIRTGLELLPTALARVLKLTVQEQGIMKYHASSCYRNFQRDMAKIDCISQTSEQTNRLSSVP